MTLVTLPSPIFWPGLCGAISGGAPGFGNIATLDASGEYAAFVFVAREAMVISHVSFRVGTPAVGSPTATVTIEDLDASGFPSGTPAFGSSSGTSATISANTNVLVALGASATIAKGTFFCVKITYASGTSFIPAEISNTGTPFLTNNPYRVVNTGAPTKGVLNGAVLGLGSSSTTFYQLPGTIPLSAITNGSFNNTNSAKRGLRFTLPFNCRIIGIRWYNSNNTGDYNAVLYNDAGTELSSSSTAFDGDAGSASANAACQIYFDNAVSGSAGTTYRAAIEPSSATNVNVTTMTLVSSSYRGASPAGTTAHYTTFASGSWTDTATDQLPIMDIIIDQIDDGSGTGGGGGQRVFNG